MNKSKINFIIDAVMFLGMMFLAGSGFVRKYVLLGGSASRQTYGQKVNMYMMGYSRDDWSTIHLYTAYFILFLLLLHIVLHWKQITVMYRRLIGSSRLRMSLLLIFVIASIFLAIFPFILQPTFL